MLFSIALLWLICHAQGDEFLDKFNQHKYKIKDLRTEVIDYDKDKMNYFDLKTFKHNRTTPAVNSTINFKVHVQDKLDVVVQAYKLASNQYRHFPLRFRVNAQKAFEANVAGLQVITKCGNVTDLSFSKDTTYFFCNYIIDSNKMPPLVPTGQYKLEVIGLYLENTLFNIHVYAEIFIPMRYPDSR